MNNFENMGLSEIESHGGITEQKEKEILGDKKLEDIKSRGKDVFLHGLRMLEALRSMKATTENQDETYFELVDKYKKEYDPNYESGFSTKQELDEFTNKYVLHENTEQKIAA